MRIRENILYLMEKKNITIDDLIKETGIDKNVIENLLNNNQAPGVSEMLNLASALDVDMSVLLYGEKKKHSKAVKTKWSERVRVDGKGKLNYESLAPNYFHKKIEPFIVEIFKTDEKDLDISQHAGEEFHYVMKGKAEIIIDKEKFILEEGDTIYFDSSLPHSLNSITERTQLLSAIYYQESLAYYTKGRGMKAIIESARTLKNKKLVLICPDSASITAVNQAIYEKIISSAILVGNRKLTEKLCGEDLKYFRNYEFIEVDDNIDNYELNCAKIGVLEIKKGNADMIMKGKINTSYFVKAILDKKEGIPSGRRISLISIFELPDVNRIIILTDPGINPELFVEGDIHAAIDIIKNGIEVAKSLGVEKPRVALLDANEIPSEKIPTTVKEKDISEMDWKDAYVYGPLSYDLALYEDAVKKKGIKNNPVAGKADILVVPHIAGGNFIYKTWVKTLGAEVANIVSGAKVPIILTSRGDTEISKFLTICASSIYGEFIGKIHKEL
jgi:phosphate butyryltransferase